MTKTSHTAAPWHVDFVDSDLVYSANGLRVAVTYCEGQDRDMPLKQVKANASLIAAAPDLLAALIRLADETERRAGCPKPLIAEARAAIVKAQRRNHHYKCKQCGCVHHADFIPHEVADA
jgi:hypothetical protein